MFVNNTTGRRGLVAQYDVVCFDEVSGVSFDTKEGVNILKGYMESGEFSRGKESIRADGGIVMVGNFDVDVDERTAPPPSLRAHAQGDARRHRVPRPHTCLLAGWDVPKLDPSYFSSHFRLVSGDFLAECWNQLRRVSRLVSPKSRLEWGSQLSGRDRKAANNTVNRPRMKLLARPGRWRSSDESVGLGPRRPWRSELRPSVLKSSRRSIGAA